MTGLIDHLERQLASARRLLQTVIAQRDAIRAQDVESVLARLAEVQQEMGRRMQLERERDVLLDQASTALRRPASDLTLEMILVLLSGDDAVQARALSAELRGTLSETARIHGQNRVLIRQELAFLDHLMRVLSGTPEGAYSAAGGSSTRPQVLNLIDTRV
ncbi:MAG: flagellar export chaperone FlgN [Gaiellales bacterium]|jgi:flagellar biosynthesis/type III secretory pathway chaperone